MDVNQDNGNKDIWENWRKKKKKRKRGEETKSLSHHHIDVYDSRVYPCPEKEDEYFDEDTLKEEKSIPSDKGTKIDLSACKKEPRGIMRHLIRQIQGQIKLVKVHNTQEGVTKKKVVLSLPIGFDSSVDEKAPCGTCNFGAKLPEDSLKRFSREDYDYFFEQLNFIIKNNKDVISGALITLEGGYTLGISGLEGYVARMLSKLGEMCIAASTTPIANLRKPSDKKGKDLLTRVKFLKEQRALKATRFSSRLIEMASATGTSSSG